MNGVTLAADFPAVSRDDWMKRVEQVLKGASFAEKLVSSSPDGISLQPIHGQENGPRAERAQHLPWTLCQRVDHPDAAKANQQALDDLSNGAAGLVLVAHDAHRARGFGIDPGRLARVLEDVHLHAVSLKVEGSGSMELAGLIAGRPIDPERLAIAFNVSDPNDAVELARLGYSGPYMEADGRRWHGEGATDAQELGCVLADAANHMRGLDRLNDAHLVKAVGVTLAAGQDMFMTLAKFRAMRLLWRRLLQASGLADAPLRLHAETSWRMMATLDPHTNILRATAAVFGAGLGGADSISVLPFSLAQGLPNAFARRVARNVQTVLIEEANLWRVADPASGSGYVEHLTRGLCDTAWKVFQEIEAGRWPVFSSASTGLPVIGTSAYRLASEYSPEVERL